MVFEPLIYRIDLEPAAITLIHDGELDVAGAQLFKGFERAQWAGSIGEREEGLVTPQVTVVLVEVDGQRLLLDTGLGRERSPQRRGGHLFPALARLGLSEMDIDQVVISHAHGDHLWGGMVRARGRLVPAFPAARYHLPAPDWHWLQRWPHNPSTSYLAPLTDSGQLVLDEPDGLITASVRSIDTAGHSPGHRCLAVTTPAGTFCFLGDLVHHPALHFAYPDRTTGFDYQPALTPAARRRLATQAVAGDWLLAAAHGSFPPLGRLAPRAEADGWHWQPITG